MYQPLIRRDCPELIVPDSTDVLTTVPGTAAWALSASFRQITASLPQDTIIHAIGAGITHGVSQLLTADISVLPNMLSTLHIYSGPSGLETEIARVTHAMGCNAITAGWVNDAITVSIYGATSMHIPIAPIFVLGGSRLASKTARSDASTAYLSEHRIWLVGYDPALYQACANALIASWREFGWADLSTHRAWPPAGAASGAPNMATVTNGGVAWSTAVEGVGYGAYTELDPELDADYLITGIAVRDSIQPTTPQRSMIINLAVGQPGNETVQARALIQRTAVGTISVGYVEFPDPFIAYAGERLSARSKGVVASRDYHLVVHGKKLQRKWS